MQDEVITTVADVLGTPALVDEITVRTVAPALVIIVEQDCPARIELAGIRTDAERRALQSFLDQDELSRELLAAYFAHNRDDPTEYDRTDRHNQRLAAGQTVADLRAR